MARDNISAELYDLLVTKNFDPEVTDEKGKPSQPSDGRVFSFDYIAGSGKNYGTVVIVINENNEFLVFFGDNMGQNMEGPDRSEWFDEFLPQMKHFAVSNGMDRFTPQDLYRLKHTMAGMAAIKEGLFEGYYGTRKVSYTEGQDARLMIKHSRPLGENDARHRHIQSLFIETADGERWKLGFTHLAGGRAMLEHVRQGGRPYDARGVHISEMVSEIKVLSRFNRARANRMFEGITQEVAELAQQHLSQVKKNLSHLASSKGYQQYFESWQPAQLTETDTLVEDLRNLFVEQSIDQRIEEALPLLAKLKQGNNMKEADVFESWANRLVEGTWALPDTPEAREALKQFMSKEQPVGADAVNATNALYDVIGDDDLFDRLGDLADENPDADARIVVKNWIEDNLDDPELADLYDTLGNNQSSPEDEMTEGIRLIKGPHGDMEITDTPTGQTVRRVSGYKDYQPGLPNKRPEDFHVSDDPRSYRPSDFNDETNEGDNLATFSGPNEGMGSSMAAAALAGVLAGAPGDHPAEPVAEPKTTSTADDSDQDKTQSDDVDQDLVDLHFQTTREDSKDAMDRRGGVWDSFYEELELIKRRIRM